MRLTELERPFICTNLAEETVAEAVRSITAVEDDGARAFEVHLPPLGFSDGEAVDRVLSTTTVPIYATIRRAQF